MRIKNINGVLHVTLISKGIEHKFTAKDYTEVFKKAEKIIGHPYAI